MAVIQLREADIDRTRPIEVGGEFRTICAGGVLVDTTDRRLILLCSAKNPRKRPTLVAVPFDLLKPGALAGVLSGVEAPAFQEGR